MAWMCDISNHSIKKLSMHPLWKKAMNVHLNRKGPLNLGAQFSIIYFRNYNYLNTSLTPGAKQPWGSSQPSMPAHIQQSFIMSISWLQNVQKMEIKKITAKSAFITQKKIHKSRPSLEYPCMKCPSNTLQLSANFRWTGSPSQGCCSGKP